MCLSHKGRDQGAPETGHSQLCGPLGPHLSFSRGGGSLELAGPVGPLNVIGVHAAGPRSLGGP